MKKKLSAWDMLEKYGWGRYSVKNSELKKLVIRAMKAYKKQSKI